MYDGNYFRESYYEHACTIITEQDVLDIDIKGNGWISKLKRKWYDMFLLSYSDHRARYHFTSSYAMRLERARQFRKYMSSIHPMSKFRSCWDLMMLYVTMTNILIGQSHSSSMVCGLPIILCYMNAALDVVIILDLLVNAKSGYVIKMSGKVILEPCKVLHKYCSTKIFIHTLTAIPLQSIMLLRFRNNVECKANYFTSTIILLYALRLYRIVELSSYWTRKRNSYRATAAFRFLRIGIIFIFTILQFKYVEEAIIFFQLCAGYDLRKSINVENILYLLTAPPVEHPPLYFLKLTLLFKLRESIYVFNFGFSGSFLPESHKLIVLVPYLICYAFYIWGVLECLTHTSLVRFQENQKVTYYQQLSNLAKCRQIPDTIYPKISEYQEFNSTARRMMEMQNMLFIYLPRILKNEIAFHCYNRLLKRLPFFCDWPMDVIEELVLMLREEIYLRQYVIAEKGVQGDGLVIVDAGMIAVYSEDGVETRHLVDGDYFGELSLVTDKDIRMYYAVTLTTSKVLLLDKGDFRKLMRQHPHLFLKMKNELTLNYETSNMEASAE